MTTARLLRLACIIFFTRQGKAGRGMAWHGMVWHGSARQGKGFTERNGQWQQKRTRKKETRCIKKEKFGVLVMRHFIITANSRQAKETMGLHTNVKRG